MVHLNLIKLAKNDFNGLTFLENKFSEAWFIAFAIIDKIKYSGHLELDYDLDYFVGNIIVLRSDNYQDDIDFLIVESSVDSKISCYWKYTGENKFTNLICSLDSQLNVIELGKYSDIDIDLKKNNYSDVNELIQQIDEWFFYTFFDAY
jgi:hypothetical protein